MHTTREVTSGELPGGSTGTGMHVGPYDTIVETYSDMGKWITATRMVPNERMWENYLTDPQQEPDSSRWRTQIFRPVTAAHHSMSAGATLT